MLVRNGLDCLAFLMRVDDYREGPHREEPPRRQQRPRATAEARRASASASASAGEGPILHLVQLMMMFITIFAGD